MCAVTAHEHDARVKIEVDIVDNNKDHVGGDGADYGGNGVQTTQHARSTGLNRKQAQSMAN